MRRYIPVSYTHLDVYKRQELKGEIQDKEAELYVVFPEDFDEAVAAYDSQTASGPAPNVEIYYLSLIHI